MKTFTPKGNTVGMIMPVFIMKAKVSHGAKILYTLLCDFSGHKDHCWPSHAKLAQKLYCSISSIKRYLAELAKEKFIFIQNKKQTSSVYYMLDISFCGQVKMTYPQSKLTYPQSKLNYESNLNKLILRNTPPISPTKGFSKKGQKGRGHIFKNINTTFETFWTQYPKKEGKELARSVWHNMAKASKLPALNKLSAALQHFCKSESWQREYGRYVPQLVNWLKNMRWHDITPSELEATVRPLTSQKAIKQPCLLNKELSQLKVLFEQFASYFCITSQGIKNMAFGLWSFLHEKNIAPKVLKKQSDNIVTYLKNYKIAMLCSA